MVKFLVPVAAKVTNSPPQLRIVSGPAIFVKQLLPVLFNATVLVAMIAVLHRWSYQNFKIALLIAFQILIQHLQ
jgi:hypothetical protein